MPFPAMISQLVENMFLAVIEPSVWDGKVAGVSLCRVIFMRLTNKKTPSVWGGAVDA